MVAAGYLVGTHRDAAPLLELAEGALDDVAAAVAVTLLVAEINRPARSLVAVGDLVRAFGGCGSDASFAQAGPIGLDGYPLSAITRTRRVRGRPAAPGTRIWSRVSISIEVSAI
nr:hypothetical protein [Leifsonia aquatica]